MSVKIDATDVAFWALVVGAAIVDYRLAFVAGVAWLVAMIVVAERRA